LEIGSKKTGHVDFGGRVLKKRGLLAPDNDRSRLCPRSSLILRTTINGTVSSEYRGRKKRTEQEGKILSFLAKSAKLSVSGAKADSNEPGAPQSLNICHYGGGRDPVRAVSVGNGGTGSLKSVSRVPILV
jgi:hypothetical protein